MRASKPFSCIALILLGLLFGGIGTLQAQVDCNAMAFTASNHDIILIDLPTTTACQNPTYTVLVRKSGTGAPYTVPGSISFFTIGSRELAVVRDLDPCTRYDFRVIVYCGAQFVGICHSQGIYATTGCTVPDCDGVMPFNVGDNTAFISLAGFESCRVGTQLFFETQWRPVGSPTWMSSLSQTSGTFKHLEDLEPCTEYEYQIRVMCDSTYLPWCTGTFKTEGCPCDDCGLTVDSISVQNPVGCSQTFTVSTTMTGNCTIVSYDFDFGNGNSATSVTNPTTWVYTESGKYDVCVTVNAVNLAGDTCKVSFCESFEITGCVDCEDCEIELNTFDVVANPSDPCTHLAIVSSSARVPCTLVDYTFFWGDGTSSTSTIPFAVHTYADDGMKTVCVIVSVDNGSSQICTYDECKSIMVEGCKEGGKALKMPLKEPFYAFPNPVQAGASLSVVLPEGGAKLSLVDLSGRTILEKSVTTGGGHHIQIPSDLPAGIYLLRDAGDRFEPQRILVQ